MSTRTPAGFVTPERKATYAIWRGMLRRCFSPLVSEFQYYGERGITVCGRWLNFADFLADMGLRPENMSIDRIDSDGNYEPGNCRWATSKEQAATRRPSSRARTVRPIGLEFISRRERQIAVLMHQGHRTRAIAAMLELSEHTARSYVKSLYAHAGVKSRSELVLLVERHGEPG